MVKTDQMIHADILEELDWDPELSAKGVGVQVDDGVVTLTGKVDRFHERLAAEEAAFRIQGVRAVANELSVKGPGVRDDTDLAKAAAAAIEANSLVPAGKIDITVKNGKITLAGEVNWNYQKSAANNAVRHLPGVRDVINLVHVMQPSVSATEIGGNIERALVRRAELDANQIRIHVEGGQVTLTGTVRSLAEKREAGLAVWRAKGVQQVTNQLEVHAL